MSLTHGDQDQYLGESLQPNLLASTIVGLTVATIAVALRVCARRKTGVGFGNDDWLILAALVALVGYSAAGICAIAFGEGKHIIEIENKEGFIKSYITAVVAYAVVVVFTKTSLLCFYCRVFPSKGLRRLSWVVGTFIVLYNMGTPLVAGLQCIPLSSLWTGQLTKCFDPKMAFTVFAIINLITDVAVLAIPVRFVVRLQMRRVRKLQICAIFLLGGVVCIFGIVRTVALVRAPPGDPTYNQVWSGLWSFCEVSVGIVAACLPTTGVFFTKATVRSVTGSIRQWYSSCLNRRSGNTDSHQQQHSSTYRSVKQLDGISAGNKQSSSQERAIPLRNGLNRFDGNLGKDMVDSTVEKNPEERSEDEFAI